MSTLVKLLLGLIIQLLHTGEIPQDQIVSKAETYVSSKYTVDELNPRYIITREELLSQQNETSTSM